MGGQSPSLIVLLVPDGGGEAKESQGVGGKVLGRHGTSYHCLLHGLRRAPRLSETKFGGSEGALGDPDTKQNSGLVSSIPTRWHDVVIHTTPGPRRLPVEAVGPWEPRTEAGQGQGLSILGDRSLGQS